MISSRRETAGELRDELRSLLPHLTVRFKVESIALFGSYVRGDQRPDSDLDLLVTFREVPSLFGFIELEDYLSEALGVKVDLVMKDSLKPRIGQRILTEAVPL